MKESNSLRNQAEKKVNTKKKEHVPENTNELVNELQIHQAELEIQNEELIKSQEELSELYNKYYDLYNDVPVGYFTLDNDGIIRNVNFKGTELLQLDKEVIIGRGFSQFILKDDENKYFNALANAFDTGKNQELELLLKRGEMLFDAHMEVMPLFDRDGSRYRIIITDITEHKKAEESLIESEEKFRTLFESMNEAFMMGEIILDEERNPYDFRYLSVNKAAAQAYGMDSKQLVNKRFKELFPDIEPPNIKEIGEVALTGKPVKDMEIFSPVTGNWLEIDIYSPKKGFFSVFTRIITKRKNAEMAMLESSNLLRSIMEGTSDPVYVKDRKSKIIMANSALGKVVGKPLDQIIGKTDSEYYEDQEVGEALRKNDLQIMKSGKSQVMEETVTTPNGNYTFISNKAPYYDIDGEIIGIIGISHDITRRKKTEEALKASEEMFNTFFNASPATMDIFDKEFRYVKFNKAVEKFYNKRADEIQGKSVEEIAPGFLSAVKEPFEAILRTGVAQPPMEIHGESPREPGVIEHFLLLCFPVPLLGGERGIGVVAQDITELKKAEEELDKARNAAESEVIRLQTILEALPVGVMITDVTGKAIMLNDALNDMWRGSRPLKNLDDYPEYKAWDVKTGMQVKPEDWPVSKAIDTGKPQLGVEFDFQRFDDTKGTMLISAVPIKDKKSRITGGIAIAQETTEHKKAEQELKEARDNLEIKVEERTNELNLLNAYNRSLIEASLDPLVTIGSDGKINDVNKATELVTGYSRDELIDTDFSDYFTEPEKAKRGYKKVFREGEVHDYPLEIKHKKGHLTPVLYNASVYKDDNGDVVGIFAAARDITESRKAQEQIRAQANMLSQVNDAIIAIDNDFIVTYWNKGAEHLYGLKSDEILGKSLSYAYRFEWLTPDGEKEAYRLLETVGNWRGENIHIKRNGERIYVDSITTVLKDKNGNPEGLLSVIRNITEKKQTENQLKEAIQELERSNKELQSFAYITSHDLQEPLRTIASFTQLMERRYKNKLDSDADEFMDYIVVAAKRMKDMIQGLLDYSRVDTQGQQFKEFSSEDTVNLALNHLLSSVDECNAEISYENLPRIIGDEHQIERVFQNLLSNALKFRKEKVKLEVHILAQRNNGEYIFSVADNGIGMDKQYSERIFEPFRRLHTIDAYDGTGIGLAIVKRIIEHHGGRIWFESELGVGSTFYFTIPIRDDVVKD